MRIALVTESFHPAVDPAVDGTTTTVTHVADRLLDTGHQVLLVAAAPGPADYRGSPVVRVGTHHQRGSAIRDALADFRPDLVHVASPRVLGRKALKQSRRLGVPTLTVQHDPLGESADYWRAKVAQRSDRVLVTCRWLGGQLAELGVESQLWEPGVDVTGRGRRRRDPALHDRWARGHGTEGTPVVAGYVGGLHRRHGVRRLREVATVPGLRLVVVGDGPQRAWLRRHLPDAQLLGATGNASTGRGDLAVALATLDLLVHPGDRETDCHALREAAASGVPVVAPAAGGALEVVAAGRTGLLYDPTAEGALRAAVTELAADPVRRVLLGAQARAEAAGRPWESAVDDLLTDHYPAVAGRSPLQVA